MTVKANLAIVLNTFIFGTIKEVSNVKGCFLSPSPYVTPLNNLSFFLTPTLSILHNDLSDIKSKVESTIPSEDFQKEISGSVCPDKSNTSTSTYSVELSH